MVLLHESELNDVMNSDSSSGPVHTHKEMPVPTESYKQKSWYKLSALSAFEEELLGIYGIPTVGLVHQNSSEVGSSTANTVAAFIGNLTGTHWLTWLTHLFTGLLTHSLTHSLIYSLTYSPTHLFTGWLAHSLTHLLTHSLTHSPTHSPTHSSTHSSTRWLLCDVL